MTGPSAAALRIEAGRAGVIVVDVQERLAPAMPEERLALLVKGTRALLEMARRHGMPVLVTQQYPRGLGPTIPAIEECLDGLGDGLTRYDKIEFSACRAPEFDAFERDAGRSQWILVGMESHVCVYQTARQLVERGAQVFVPADAVVSRTDENRRIGLDLMKRAGAIPTSSETVIFDVLGRAGGDDFKALSRLIK